MRQHPAQAPVIAGEDGLEDMLGAAAKAIGLLLALALEEERAHHRRQGQRDEGRDQHGDGDGHREFMEQPADDAAHEKQRDEDGDEGEGDGDDGEADLPRPFDGGLERAHPLLEIAHDVLDHHDRVVDDEADGDGEAHEGQIVEAIAQQIHDREGADQRQRHRGTGDDRSPRHGAGK